MIRRAAVYGANWVKALNAGVMPESKFAKDLHALHCVKALHNTNPLTSDNGVTIKGTIRAL
jgi:hypothetical protein